jgi:hypothetical protein
MSVFGSIMSSIFGSPAAAASAAPQPQPGPQPNGGAKARASAPPAAQASAKTQSAPAAPTTQVDVAAVMDNLAKAADQKLDWRRSIVDLTKLLKLDSSLTARKKLAQELSFTGDTNDTAAMNIWLHKQVMIKLADNGGKVPAELKH